MSTGVAVGGCTVATVAVVAGTLLGAGALTGLGFWILAVTFLVTTGLDDDSDVAALPPTLGIFGAALG